MSVGLVVILTPESHYRELCGTVAGSPALSCVLARWVEIGLPDCWLSGSAVAQTRWNAKFGKPPHHGIADVDLIYFDPSDVSAEAEEGQAARVRSLFADLPMRVDVKNQARVHLWYEEKFGYPIAPYQSSKHALSTFPTTAGAVGVRRCDASHVVHAPFGLHDLLDCVVRPNKAQITRPIYEAKVARWRTMWPDLTVVDW